MKGLNDFLNKALEGLDITQEEKTAMVGIYTISLYKGYLELLLSYKGSDLGFIRNLNEFLESQADTLGPNDRKSFDEALEAEKQRVLDLMMDKVTDILSEEEKKKFAENITTAGQAA